MSTDVDVLIINLQLYFLTLSFSEIQMGMTRGSWTCRSGTPEGNLEVGGKISLEIELQES